MINKVLGYLAFYLPPPLPKYIHRIRGVVIGDLRTLFIGTNVNIENSYPHKVSIGKNVTISSGVRITAHIEPPKTIQSFLPSSVKEIVIGNNVYIGADAIILQGVKVNDWTVIGAGSVVTKNVPKFKIVAGNPAKVIGDIRALNERVH